MSIQRANIFLSWIFLPVLSELSVEDLQPCGGQARDKVVGSPAVRHCHVGDTERHRATNNGRPRVTADKLSNRSGDPSLAASHLRTDYWGRMTRTMARIRTG